MNYNEALSKIPVIVSGGSNPGDPLRLKRRAVQIGTIVVALLIPITGLLRIDPEVGAFVVIDRQIWFADFFLVFGLWLALASGLVVTYSALGTAFCGWMCPQNTISEWANRLTHKWLGKRAEVSLDGTPVNVSRGKNKLSHWIVLGLIFLVISMAIALIPLFYFYPPSVVWSFITFQDDIRLAGSLHWIYMICTLIILLDVAFIRHFLCRFMCVYRVWQHSFKTQETLHIEHDKSHPDECNKCNFCQASCIVDIDPRNTVTYDACINCGVCISVCNDIRASRNTGGSLLRFAMGNPKGTQKDSRSSNDSLLGRIKWTIPLTVLGTAMFIWGLWSYNHYHMSVYQSDMTMQVSQIQDYRISIAHKLYTEGTVDVTVEGLPEGSYHLSSPRVSFNTAERRDIQLHIDDLPAGIYQFTVHARSHDGWQDSFRTHHVVTSDASGNKV